jgi:D-serine deaminase-like pyridoxal phosphate-dependent protein
MSELTTAELTPSLGDTVDDLETPILLVDVDQMERNVSEMTEFAERNNVTLRSHVKTHKNAELAKMESEAGGDAGIVCQKLGEVEVMAKNGIDDIYLSYQVVGEKKLDRLVWLSKKLDYFCTTVDHEKHVRDLQAAAERGDETVKAVLEIDVGLGRTGIQPGEPAVELAKLVDEQPNVEFEGLLVYEAHVKSEAETREDYERLCKEAMDVGQETVDAIEDAGIEVSEVRVGGTATSPYSGKHPVVTEINPGMYPFNDVGELEHRPFDVDKSDCAATVATTVISTPTEDRAVVDGGSKTFGMDIAMNPVPRYRDDVEYVNASEEHGWLDTSEADDVSVGDRIEFIVPHVCTTINLHDYFVGYRDGEVTDLWEVQARGKVR